MTVDLAAKYDLRVPRYTSYPTAPHFDESVDGDVYRGWLADLDPATELSLYSHIPFCDEMCWFCGCYTKIVKRYEPVAEYLETLLQEIDLLAGALPGRLAARHLHWGGGSPTMLTGDDWLRLIDRLRAAFRFTDDAEVAVELDPRTATEDYVRALARAGVNRTSIGQQDFHPETQRAINRIQPFEMTEQVVGWMRAHGISALNMDLMYGLPYQTADRVREMVDLTVRLKPRRVALFGYAHVPWMKTHQKMIPEETLPDTAERWAQVDAASERLVAHGYVAVGLDHFALPEDELAVALGEGRLHRNFQGYTTDTAQVMLGLGASAIGQLPQGYAQNASPLKAHRESVADGRFPITRGLALSEEDRVRGAIIERLMCDLRVDVAAVATRHGRSADDFAEEFDKLEPLVADGLVAIDGATVAMTPAGRPFLRLAAAAFDAYLNRGAKRYSKAV